MPEIDCVAALCCVTLSLMPFRPEGRKKTVPISTQYATLSENGKALMLPEGVHTWLQGAQHFLVIMENDEIILKKVHQRRSLDDLVKSETQPLSPQELNNPIHETRK